MCMIFDTSISVNHLLYTVYFSNECKSNWLYSWYDGNVISQINVTYYYLSNETNQRSVAVTVLELQAKTS